MESSFDRLRMETFARIRDSRDVSESMGERIGIKPGMLFTRAKVSRMRLRAVTRVGPANVS